METSDTPQPWQSYHTVYTNAKAGMEGVNKEKVQRVVYEMSKGSKYFQNEERKEAFIRQKIANMQAQCSKLTAKDLSHYRKVAEKRILELEATRDLSRIWLHVDMDAFYAAVETLANPSLKGKPMAVGSLSMISTANYEARKFGVRAAMPGFIAQRLCPEIIFVPTDFKKYTYYSDLTRKVFQRYDPNFVAASLDEAYLNITDVISERGISSEEIAKELRVSVYEETGLTCSAGVAPNRLLAKVCSDINKPNGQFILLNNRNAVMTFISSLPIRKIGGIGKVTERILKDVFGISTCEEMLQKGDYLCALFSHSTVDFFLSVGLGLGRTDAPLAKFRKSISNERTFAATEDEMLIFQRLADLSDMLSTDMQKEGLCGRTLTLKLKTASFEVRNRAVTLKKYICSSEDILLHASKLLKAELPLSLRLIGLRMSHFNEEKFGALSDPTQRTLTRFVLSGDASEKTVDDHHCSLDSNASDNNHFTYGTESGLSTSGLGACHYDYEDSECGHHFEALDDSNCTSNQNGELEKISSNESKEKVDNPDNQGQMPNSYETEVSKLAGAGSSFPEQSEKNYDDRAKIGTQVKDEVSDQKEQILWVNDYKCSLCGIELPPSFFQERQEHSDFHIAEKLQGEESGIRSRAFISIQRTVHTDKVASQRKHKRHKPTPKEGSYIPIDLFFVKSNQNF